MLFMKHTYSQFTVQPNPVRCSQSIDKDSEESLVVGVHDAHKVEMTLSAHYHRIIPTQVARYDPVVVAPVLDIGWKRVVVGVSRRLGCI